MNTFESLKHGMGMQISCGVHSKVLEEGVVSTVEAETRSVFRELAQRQESEIIEGRLMPDHVHMLIRYRRSIRCRP